MALSNEQKMLKERIRFVLAKFGKTATDLGDTENEKVRARRQVLGDALVQTDLLQKLLYMFPSISADYLLMGEGSMMKADHMAPHVYTQHNEVKGNSAGGDINVGPDTIVTKKTVDDLTAKIAELEKDKATLQNLLNACAAGMKK